ncbi:MAG: hypothetical protein IJU98_00580, partial [Synergistaceae bacterium]|nr:hypothetical protein [Synergistaceae bacterium]
TSSIIHKLQEPRPNAVSIRRDLELAGFWQVKPDEEQIRFAFTEELRPLMTELSDTPDDTALIECIYDLISLFTDKFDWALGLYEAQNLYYELLKRYRRGLRSAPEKIREPMYRLGRVLRFSDEMLGH